MGHVFCWGLLALAISACGSNDDPPIFPGGGDGGPRPDGSDPADASDDPDGPSIDGSGAGGAPRITLVAPEAGTLIAGLVTIEVDVADDDNVKDVAATIAGIHEIDMSVPSAGTTRSTGIFDTTVLAGLVAPTIVVRARDFEDNESELGFVITLDNEPPVAELDPANVRSSRTQSGVFQCSRDFDPVGGDAPNDGESVGQLTELRGRIVDLGNTGTISSTLFIPVAGVASVRMYVLDDTTRPLVVDSNADGICDDVNPEIVPTTTPSASNEAAVLTLGAIEATGASFFGSDVFGGTNSACTAGNDILSPPPVCDGEPTVTKVIQTFDEQPEIYGIPPAADANCLGFAFDARASNISDGPACVALLVIDNLGNRSVSTPLRICVNSDGTAANCPPIGQSLAVDQRPNCTGTVTGTTVTNTPCAAQQFPVGVANEFELVAE